MLSLTEEFSLLSLLASASINLSLNYLTSKVVLDF